MQPLARALAPVTGSKAVLTLSRPVTHTHTATHTHPQTHARTPAQTQAQDTQTNIQTIEGFLISMKSVR